MQKQDLVIGVPREIYQGCRCVAMVPEIAKKLVSNQHKVLIQRGVA